MRQTIWALLLLGGCSGSHAAGLSQLYPPATLQSWGERYQRSTTRILDEVIWPALLSDEKARLGNRKPVLDFPMYAAGDSRDNPLAFYSPYDSKHVVAPLLSLKFLDDLSIAYAWLQAKGYSLETISEYTAILHYGNPPDGGFPPPLTALGIPPNATDQRDVDEAALGHFVTARTFILLHEMGHILYRHHGGRNSAESIRNEEQADQFAIDVMKRTPLPPLGMLVFFMADAHWSDYPANAGTTHPMSGERVRALAGAIPDSMLAAKLRAFGELLDDAEIRKGLAATGVAGDLAALSPRRPGELPRVANRPRTSGSQPFDGFYRGELVQFLDPRPVGAEFALERHGDHVAGRFTAGLGFFVIKESKVVGNQLYFDWEFGSNYGRGVIEITTPGRFKGTWGYRESRTGAGTLSASAVQSAGR